MFCHKCGTQAIDDAFFCAKCGAKLDIIEQESATQSIQDEHNIPINRSGSDAKQDKHNNISTKDTNNYTKTKNTNGFFSKLLNGDLGLAKTFWGVQVGGALIIGFVHGIVKSIAPSLLAIQIFSYVVISFEIVVTIGTYKAASKHTGKKYWPFLAQVICGLTAIGIPAQLYLVIVKHRDYAGHEFSQTNLTLINGTSIPSYNNQSAEDNDTNFNWIRITDNNTFTEYYNPAAIRKGNISKLLILDEYKVPFITENNVTKSVISEIEFNCNMQSFHVPKWTNYSESMGKGKSSSFTSSATLNTFVPITTSFIETEWNIACGIH